MSDSEQIEKAIRLLAKSITADDASPTFDANGGYVSCLTESMLSVANAIYSMSNSIQDLADAIREVKHDNL